MVEKFNEWARARCQGCEKIKFGGAEWEDQHRLGVTAVEPIASQAEMITIDYENLISLATLEDSDHSDYTFKIYNYWSDGSEYDIAIFDVFALYLLHEKFYVKDSELKPWLDVLPDVDEMHNSLFWSPYDLERLDGSPLLKRIETRSKETREHYDWNVENIFRGESCFELIQQLNFSRYPRIWRKEPTYQEYKWAMAIARQRSVRVTVDGIYYVAIAPIFDQFLHTPAPLNPWAYYEDREQLIVFAKDDIAPGQQILVSLGEKCNSELVDFFGFLIEDNPDDCVHLTLEIEPNDPDYSQKLALFYASRIDNSKIKFTNKGYVADMMSLVDMIVAPREEFQYYASFQGAPNRNALQQKHADFRISRYLANLAQKALAAYPTSLEEDLQVLNNSSMLADLSHNEILALKVCVGEKNILFRLGQHFYQAAQNFYQQLPANNPAGSAEQKNTDEL